MSVPMPNVVADMPLPCGQERLSIPSVIRRYHGSLLSFLRQRVRTAEDAADVAQEAYIRMLQYEGSQEIKSPSSLLFRIAINVANDLGRSDQVRHVNDQCAFDGMDIESERATPERELSAEQDLNILFAAIEQLPPKCKQVFLLSRVECMTYPAIAQHCGISVKMVEKHISHALAVCVAKMQVCP